MKNNILFYLGGIAAMLWGGYNVYTFEGVQLMDEWMKFAAGLGMLGYPSMEKGLIMLKDKLLNLKSNFGGKLRTEPEFTLEQTLECLDHIIQVSKTHGDKELFVKTKEIYEKLFDIYYGIDGVDQPKQRHPE